MFFLFFKKKFKFSRRIKSLKKISSLSRHGIGILSCFLCIYNMQSLLHSEKFKIQKFTVYVAKKTSWKICHSNSFYFLRHTYFLYLHRYIPIFCWDLIFSQQIHFRFLGSNQFFFLFWKFSKVGKCFVIHKTLQGNHRFSLVGPRSRGRLTVPRI